MLMEASLIYVKDRGVAVDLGGSVLFCLMSDLAVSLHSLQD